MVGQHWSQFHHRSRSRVRCLTDCIGGRGSHLGWRWSGEECMTAVAETFFRPVVGWQRAGTRPAPTGTLGGIASALGQAHEGRHKACPYRGHGGRFRGTTWVGDRWHRLYAGDAAPTWHGVRGALRGESPRTREGRRPDRTTAVVGGQWSVGRGNGTCSGRGRELALGWSLAEVYESSPPVWTAAILGICLLTAPNCDSMNQAILDHIYTGKPYVRLHRMRYLESRR